MTALGGEGSVRRVLIANRGEVAVRIVRACHDLGIEAVVAFSVPDRQSLAVTLADQGVCIGEGPAHQSYLDAARILAVAAVTGCDAVHPGYGFLSENAEFARSCEEAGVIFVGPRSDVISLLGDKISARQTAQDAGLRVVPGSEGAVVDAAHARHLADDIGYPVLVKARGGGGGKGLRRVDHAGDLEQAVLAASNEAGASFGSRELYMEKFIRNARHIELQVVVDNFGSAVALGERDCTVQRSYQKLVEESPSPVLDDDTRAAMAADALALVSTVGYTGVGTVEFLFDQDTRQWFFIEMNTRLQVEHPVTEVLTGQDLVALQLRIAAGEHLPFGQDDIAPRGHALEFRINAEQAEAGFRPGAGRLSQWAPPSGPWVRVDTHCYPGYDVSPYYDSLLAKLVVWGATREEALRRAARALSEWRVDGLDTTIGFHRWVVENDDFKASRVHTRWVEESWAS